MKTKVMATITAVLILGMSEFAGATLVDSNSIIKDDIEYYIQTDKSIYDLGEDVELLYRITNLRDEEWRAAGVSPIANVIVEAKEGENFNEVWRWSWYHGGLAGTGVLRLGPGESEEMISGIWPQIDFKGTLEVGDDVQVSPGIYRISGVFRPTDSHVAVEIAIVPEPATILLLSLGATVFLRRHRN